MKKDQIFSGTVREMKYVLAYKPMIFLDEREERERALIDLN